MYRFLCTLLVLAIMIGCNKEHEPTPKPAPPTVRELLTAGPWLLVDYGYDDNNSGVIEASESQLLDCQQDNTIRYHADGSGSSSDNAIACAGNSSANFRWSFVNNEKSVEIDSNVMNIKTLSETELHFVIPLTGITPSLHTIWSRQP